MPAQVISPLISVVVPCHNAAQFIREAVDSVLAQSHSNLQIIVVDDGSTDDSVGRIADLRDRIEIVEQPNGGPAVARNAGLRAARGEFIAFLDADDTWHPRKLEVQARHAMGNSECGIVYSRWLDWRLDANGAWTPPPWPDENLDDTTIIEAESGWLYLQLLQDSVIHTSNVFFRRDVILETGLFDTSLRKGQDLDYWLRASRLSQIHKLDATLSRYRIYDASLTFQPASTNYRAMIIQRALETWGLTDPGGKSIEETRIKRVLRESWKNFGINHLRYGSARTAKSAAQKALAVAPLDLGAWRLLARSAVKSIRSGD
jgi:glycosyltransferase involved in cell wall biosynthesis